MKFQFNKKNSLIILILFIIIVVIALYFNSKGDLPMPFGGGRFGGGGASGEW